MSYKSAQLTNDEWAISERVRKYSLRTVPHIFWSPQLKRWQFMFSAHRFYTRNDSDAQDYINRLNVTKQAHPVK